MPTYFSSFFVVFVVILLSRRRRKIHAIARNIIKRRHVEMNELVEKFIGKNCIIRLIDDSFGQLLKIVAVNGSGMLVEDKNGTQRIVNLDYVISIEEKKAK